MKLISSFSLRHCLVTLWPFGVIFHFFAFFHSLVNTPGFCIIIIYLFFFFLFNSYFFVIINVNSQDMRRMGGLNRLLPFTYTMVLIGSFALIGFPFLTGYYSKDFILELACAKLHFTGNLAFWLGTISVSFTTFYSYRLLFLTFLNKNNGFKNFVLHAHEPNIFMSTPLILLAFGSIFIGYLTKDMIIGLGTSFWGQSIFILSENVIFLDAEYLPYHIRLIPFIFSHIGIFIAYNTTFFLSASSKEYQLEQTYINTTAPSISLTQASFQKNLIFYKFQTQPEIIKIYTFFNQKWHFDDFYNRFIVQKFINFGFNISFKLLDAGWIGYLGPYGISNIINNITKDLSKIQTGYVYHYAFVMLITITLFIIFLFSWNIIPFWEHSALYFIFILTFLYLFFSTKHF